MKEFKNPFSISIPCCICGKRVELTVEKEDYIRFINGESHVQDLFPYLSADKREMLISQTCGECWDKMFSYED